MKICKLQFNGYANGAFLQINDNGTGNFVLYTPLEAIGIFEKVTVLMSFRLSQQLKLIDGR